MNKIQGGERLSRQLVLAGGRRLGFAEYGAADGAPLFYFHGWPGSRLEPQLADALAAQAGVRLIGTDRPGYGLSDFQPGRKLLDWPRDILALADTLGLSRFSVIGVSGGGPYAVACAVGCGERAIRAGLVCGLAPLDRTGGLEGMVRLNRWMLAVARRAPWFARAVATASMRHFWDHEKDVLPPQVLNHLCKADRELLAMPEVQQALKANWREAFRAGAKGSAWDGCLYAQPWGFKLQECRIPVHVWQGEADVIVPPRMARLYAEELPTCDAKYYPDEGHFSLPIKHFSEFLSLAR